MKHKTDVDRIILAGAWYRLLKDVVCEASVQIAKDLDLTTAESRAFNSAYSRVFELETKVGFEQIAKPYFSSIDRGLPCLFYGSVTTSPRNDIDKKVINRIRDILNTYLINLPLDDAPDYEELLKANETEHDRIIHNAFKGIKNDMDSDLEKQTEEMKARVNRGEEK